MDMDKTGLRVKVSWKLEKFEGERQPGDLPVEIIEGEEYLLPSQLKEIQDGSDQRRT
jgi:hypothetical protein